MVLLLLLLKEKREPPRSAPWCHPFLGSAPAQSPHVRFVPHSSLPLPLTSSRFKHDTIVDGTRTLQHTSVRFSDRSAQLTVANMGYTIHDGTRYRCKRESIILTTSQAPMLESTPRLVVSYCVRNCIAPHARTAMHFSCRDHAIMRSSVAM